MVISGLGFACRPSFLLYPNLLCGVRKVRFGCIASAALETLDVPDNGSSVNISKKRVVEKWKTLSSEDLGISNSTIPKPARRVLNGLRRKGYEVYLVGGCVRDLILKRVPKDFDIITSAELKEVLRTFTHSEIVGRRFPICHVRVDDTIVEVSSFSTSARNSDKGLIYEFEKPIGFNGEDYNRWSNCMHRDFTINGLMFDPYEKLVYDYLGGINDIRKAKVRTIVPAESSFREDCARILRAIRIAARLGFGLTRDTAHWVRSLCTSILRLNKGRLMMEMNYMLAYGSAESSFRLLWKFGLLDVILPVQAEYFVRQGFRRRDKGSNMLLSLFSNLDKLLAPHRPCHGSLWFGILALHKALSDEPRDPLVVATFGLTVYNGGDIPEAVNIARRISRLHDASFNELLEPHELDSVSLKRHVIDLASTVNDTLSKLTDESYAAQALAAYPEAPHSSLMFIPYGLYLRACRVFACVKGQEKGFVPKQGNKIDYDLLALGNLQETRHVLARIIFDTIYPSHLN